MDRSETLEDVEQQAPAESVTPRDLMGWRYFGVEEWGRHYGATITEEQRCEAGEFPWSLDDLQAPCPFEPGKQVWQTHVAVLMPDRLDGRRLTIMRIDAIERERRRRVLHAPRFHKPHFYARHQTPELRWHLMRSSVSLEGEARKLQLRGVREHDRFAASKGYQLPRAVEVVLARVLFRYVDATVAPAFIAEGCPTGERYSDCYTRSTLHGHPIIVGSSGPCGIRLSPFDRDCASIYTGFLATRKP